MQMLVDLVTQEIHQLQKLKHYTKAYYKKLGVRKLTPFHFNKILLIFTNL